MSQHTPDWLSIVREKVETLRYGVVQVVIHDSKVTQIERTEKIRIETHGTTALPVGATNFDRPDTLEETKHNRASHRTTGERS
jgi:hypothetical protein